MENKETYKAKSNHGNFEGEIKIKTIDDDESYKATSRNNPGNYMPVSSKFESSSTYSDHEVDSENNGEKAPVSTSGENVPQNAPESGDGTPSESDSPSGNQQNNKPSAEDEKQAKKDKLREQEDKEDEENQKRLEKKNGNQENPEDNKNPEENQNSEGNLNPESGENSNLPENTENGDSGIPSAKQLEEAGVDPAEAGALADQAKDAADQAKDQAGQAIDQAKDQTDQAIDQAKNQAGEVIDQAKDKAGQAFDEAKDSALSGFAGELGDAAAGIGEVGREIKNFIPNAVDQAVDNTLDEMEARHAEKKASKRARKTGRDENAAAEAARKEYFQKKQYERFTPKGIAKTLARRAVKNKIINKIQNSKLGETVQEVADKLYKVSKAIKKLVTSIQFTVQHIKGIAIIAGVVLIVIIFVSILNCLSAIGGTTYVTALNSSGSSISYYEDNFTMAKITLVDANGEVIYEDLTMQELLTGMAYKALGSDACEEQYKAYMVVAKADLLSKADFNSSELNITLVNDETGVQYCPASDGCYQCDTLSTIYSEATKDKCSTGTLTDISAASDEAITKLNSAYTATEYYILAPKIDEEAGETYDFSTIDYGGNLLSSTVLTSIADSANCDTDYQTLLSGITELADYQVVDARDYLQVYYTSGCDSGEWWVPIGNDSCTPGSICSEDPYSDTFIYLYYGFTYSDGSFHKGVDIERPTRDLSYGTPIIASRGGTVEWVQNDIVGVHTTGNASYGNVVKINHGDGYVSYYEHMITGSIVVKEGDTVSQGQYLGQMGTTGYSTGVHVHFQIEYEGATDAVNGHTVDPTDYIDLDNPRPSGDTNCGMGFSGDYSSTTSGKDVFCSSLKSIGLSSNAIAAVMANAGEESGYRSNNLEDCYQENSKQCYFKSGKAYGYRQHPELQGFGTDELYTNGVDSGKYSRDNFVNDCAGYGLVQFTDSGLKANLYDFAKEKGASIGSMQMQLDYMINYEIKTSYAEVYQYLISNRSAGEISSYFCYNFERPNDPYTVCPRREANAPSYLTYINNNCSD